jgi:hypothetical protein
MQDRDIVADILQDMLTLWHMKKDQYAGWQEVSVNYPGPETKKELMVNAFANFFNCEIIDTSVGGNLSELFAYTDEEMQELIVNKLVEAQKERQAK